MLYAGILIAGLNGLVFPSIQTIMTSNVAPNEQGELQGAVSSLQSLAAIVGPPLMTSTFAAFSRPSAPVYLPGAPYLLAIGFALVSLLLFQRAMARKPLTA
jgi:DHA1 family tetracycline resistance protein-like MFS transporter